MTDTTVGGNGIIYNTLRGLFVCGIVYVLILCAMFLSAHGFWEDKYVNNMTHGVDVRPAKGQVFSRNRVSNPS